MNKKEQLKPIEGEEGSGKAHLGGKRYAKHVNILQYRLEQGMPKTLRQSMIDAMNDLLRAFDNGKVVLCRAPGRQLVLSLEWIEE